MVLAGSSLVNVRNRFLNTITYEGLTDDFLTRVAPLSFSRFTVGGRELAVFRRLVDGLQRRGIKVVLVKMPVIPVVIPLHPQGRADYSRFEQALDSVVSSMHIAHLDTQAFFSDTTEFRDPYHLNGRGSARLTPMIAGVLNATA